MTICLRLRKRWLAAEKNAHKKIKRKREHKKWEHASEAIYEQAQRKGCKWVN